MKHHAFFSALMAALLGLGGPAFAQGDGDPVAQEEARRQVNRQQRQILREQGYLLRGHRDRLSPQYRGNNYAVDDWRRHGLTAPPRGYHWVQLGGDYVLVANDSGDVRQWWPRR
ncbi:MAG: RcnB family protein [Ramlibacter sp.]|nr:RcnB family protein [Ramlibacter sp.]